MKDDPRVRAPETPVAVPAWAAEAQAKIARWERAQRRGRRITWALLPFYAVAVFVVIWTADSLIVWVAMFVVTGYQWFLPYVTARWVTRWNPCPSINPPDELSGD